MAPRSKKSTKEEAAPAVSQQTETSSNEAAASQSEKQSQLATILVGLLIIASGLLIYNYFQNASAPETTNQSEQQEENNDQANNDSSEDDESSDDEENKDGQEGQYTVMPGDSLWSIAEKVYGDGFQWRKIADANTIEKNAYGQPTVSIGQVLNVPDSAAVAQKPDDSDSTGTGATGDDKVAGIQEAKQTPNTAIRTYTVQHGDTLWSIAEQVYGNGHEWVKIFNDPHNSIGTQADGRPLVHKGNVLYLPSIE